ncbi:hypothetical protein AWM70_04380 [Paenibacillus yonginensis]|uniref:Uncharacterized protein n=1 Tax=Paenibacillus yonginensis TaxID=1462996 RepID=A0A1B1MXI9_9BACL|nr:hypothetical protein [Paenibacillus yonginensis]ANS73903.1 hypothetical protein AWM70_04380 [Paenibacillus yonginensis]
MRTLLLDVQGKAAPCCSKSHIAYRFFLPRPGGRLLLDFAYGPNNLEDPVKAKALIEESLRTYVEEELQDQAKARWESYLPLKNLITVSVDGPGGHRGAAHRHDPEQHLFLSRNEASPGLEHGELRQGMWEVTLSLHAILTDWCAYSLQIWQEEEVAR